MKKRSSTWIACALAVAAACSDVTGPGAPPHIVFMSDRAGGVDQFGRSMVDVYRMNEDGTGAENLTNDPQFAVSALSASPSTGEILFSGRDCQLWVINSDGSNKRNLSNPTGATGMGCSYGARWSPDGSRIAFLTHRERRQFGTTTGVYDVYVMNADGSNPHNVSAGVVTEMLFNVAVSGWTPDGRVVFRTDGTVNGAFVNRGWTVNADGSDPQPLPIEPRDMSSFASPDGSKVVFVRVASPSNQWQLWVSNMDGSNAKRLTTGAQNDYLLTAQSPWSPDGRTIVYRQDGSVPGVWVVNADGTGSRRLVVGTDHPIEVHGWSPDGRRILFTTTEDIYVTNADGSGTTNLTNTPNDMERDPFWARK